MKNKLVASSQIFIKQLEVPVLIGVHQDERHTPQNLYIDLAITCDISAAAADDDLTKTIDYSEVRSCIIDFVSTTDFQLVETLVNHLARHLQNTFDIKELQLSITKKPKDITDVEGVGVLVHYA